MYLVSCNFLYTFARFAHPEIVRIGMKVEQKLGSAPSRLTVVELKRNCPHFFLLSFFFVFSYLPPRIQLENVKIVCDKHSS